MRASRLKRKVGKATPGRKYPSAHVILQIESGLGQYAPPGSTGCILSGERGNGAQKRGLRAFNVR